MRMPSLKFRSIVEALYLRFQPILSLPRYAKRILVFLVDLSLCVLTVWLSFYLRLGEFVTLSGEASWAVIIAVMLALPIFMGFGLYQAIFRYSGWPAMMAVSRAVSVYGLLYASVITAFGISGVPRTIGLIQPLLLFFAVGGVRAFARYWLGGMYQSHLQRSKQPKVLIYGAGNAGRELASALANNATMRVVGFLDDDAALHGQVLNGHPIFPPDDLGDLIKTKQVAQVLLAVPSAGRFHRNQILQKLRCYQVVVRTLPSVSDLAEGRVTVSDLHELDMDDLLGREAVAPNQSLLAANVTKKIVLVTGAGGSIGSELCRQIIRLRPQQLLLLDISEFALYTIHSELEANLEHSANDGGQWLTPLLASVQDELRMREIMETWRPDTVYHAAAYKHVPMVEHNLAEGIKNNVLGTLVAVQSAIQTGVSDFVLVSTDKAVRPTNAMGASKRVAELCLQALFAHQNQFTRVSEAQVDRGKQIRLSMVRFGNVLDSSGSVIPLFRKQIREGGPLTLTHADITRYFMTIPEAAQLVIQAGAMASGGDVFVLDMGEPVKIADLARRMIELSGLSVRDEEHIDGDIEIMLTGLRPGEKLYEELLLGDNPLPTKHPRIQRAQDAFVPWRQLEGDLGKLKALLAENDVIAILEMLKTLVPDYKPNSDIVDWAYRQRFRTSGGGMGKFS